MKNNYSIAQRNAIVEDHLWCIDSIIQKNRPLMRAARLEYDDVYQQLAIRLIKAVAGYDPDKGNLQQHIFAQLKYELLNCKAAFRLCGMTGAPRGFQKSDKMTEEFYLAVKKEIATYQEKCDYLIKSGSQSPAVMDRWVLKVQALEQKKRHYEGVLQRELDGLDDEFSVLKFLSQELQVRANSIRSQRFPTKKAA